MFLSTPVPLKEGMVVGWRFLLYLWVVHHILVFSARYEDALMHSPVKLGMNLICFDAVIAGYEELRFCQNREKHIQNNRRTVRALDRILRPYTIEDNMISEQKYVYPEVLDFSWTMA